jgi:hypothetical protein
MPITVKILEKADKEWSEAALWYEEQSPGLGNRLIKLFCIISFLSLNLYKK